MNAGGRLALYGAGLVMAFGAAFGIAGAVIPDSFVTSWLERSDLDAHGDTHGDEDEQQASGHTLNGLSLDADGFALSPIEAPKTTGADGELRFQILSEAGEPVTEFTTAHERDLHLIVVRTDGAHFRHAHPTLDEHTGTWSIPWTWDEAGTYRVYADFTPATKNASGTTLTRAVEVAGDFNPVETVVRTTDEVNGFTLSLDGHLTAGASSELTISVERDGEPVKALQPYLGAFGHLVALRAGDLAYLHVHTEGDEPQPGDIAGPEIAFAAKTPTAGRYLLYLDFQVDDQVHTAEFVLDARHSDRPSKGHSEEPDEGQDDGSSPNDHSHSDDH